MLLRWIRRAAFRFRCEIIIGFRISGAPSSNFREFLIQRSSIKKEMSYMLLNATTGPND